MKKIIRRELLQKRDQIPFEIRSVKNTYIKQKLFSLPEFNKAKTILFYASFRSEVDTLKMVEESLQIRKRVVLPKVDEVNHKLILYRIKKLEELRAGFMGIPEPALPKERIINIKDIDLIVVPGVAFDHSGNRLGYGGGYYDILLSNINKKVTIVALAFEEQILQSIPSESHDIKVDIIITDKRIIRM